MKTAMVRTIEITEVVEIPDKLAAEYDRRAGSENPDSALETLEQIDDLAFKQGRQTHDDDFNISKTEYYKITAEGQSISWIKED